MHTLAQHTPMLAMLVMVALAAYCDLKTGLIPNRVVLAGAVLGALSQIALATQRGQSTQFLLYTLVGGLLFCSLVPALFYWLGAMGGGDLKLFAAVGLCVGPLTGMDIQLGSYLLSLLFLPLYLARQGRLRTTLRQSWLLFRNLFVKRDQRVLLSAQELTSVRFAPAILAAALLVSALGRSPFAEAP